jgi:hypothetical protein
MNDQLERNSHMTSKHGASLVRRVKWTFVCVALVSCSAAFMPAVSEASMSCGGRTALGKSGLADHDVEYRFGCSENVKGFGVVANTAVMIFSDSANAFDPVSGLQVDKQSFECTGNIPGVGVSCSGGKNFAAAGNRVVGNIGLGSDPCNRESALRVWLLVSDSSGAVSGPFQLGGPKECKRVAPSKGSAKRRSRKARRARR